MADISVVVPLDGQPYNLKDAQARADIQTNLPLIPDFENATPVKTYTLSIAATSVYELCRRANTSAANGTNCSNLIDNIAFRLTITGTNINAVVDVIVFWQGAQVNPFVIVNNRTYSTTAATTGIRYLHFECPTTLNDENHPWLIDFAAYNKTARSIKVEVFKTTENITWKETTTATIYNADYWTRQSLTLYTTRGIVTNTSFIPTMKVSNATTADKASYITSYLTQFLTGAPPVAGEALIKNSLVYISDNKIWEASNKTKPILTDIGTMCCTSAYASGGTTTYTYLRQKSQMTDLTQDSNLTWTNFSKGDPLYLRCTTSDGNVYSDAYVSNSMAPGYTWGYIGIAETSTAALVDGGKTFITLDSNGYLTHINGKEIASGGTVVSLSGQTLTVGTDAITIPSVTLSNRELNVDNTILTIPSVTLSDRELSVDNTTLTIPSIIPDPDSQELDWGYMDEITIDGVTHPLASGNRINFYVNYNSTTVTDLMTAINIGRVPIFTDFTNSRMTMQLTVDSNNTFHFPCIGVVSNQYVLYDYALDVTDQWTLDSQLLPNVTVSSNTITVGSDSILVPHGITGASIDSGGLISFTEGSDVRFTLQLPIYSGGVS